MLELQLLVQRRNDFALRRWIKNIIWYPSMQNSWFDKCILVCIIVSSLSMAAAMPLSDPGSDLNVGLALADKIFTVIFVVECVMKIIALGFVFGPKSYLRNWWNILDFFIVLVSVFDLTLTYAVQFLGEAAADTDLSILKIARILRALRPLRLIGRNPNLKLVVSTLLKAIPELANLIVVGLLFFLIFGLMAVSSFKGTFHGCLVAEGNPFAPMVTPELADFEVNMSAADPLADCEKAEDLLSSSFCRRQNGTQTERRVFGLHVTSCSTCARELCNADADKVARCE